MTLRQLLELFKDHAAHLDDVLVARIHGDLWNIVTAESGGENERGTRNIILQVEDE